MAMAVDEFQTWKTRERATPLAIEREGLASRPTTAATSS